MVYVLIDHDNGTWKARSLNDFAFRYYAPGKPWAEREKMPDFGGLEESHRGAKDVGAALDRLKQRVHEEACEAEGKHAVVKYVYTNSTWDYYQRLLKEHHERPTG